MDRPQDIRVRIERAREAMKACRLCPRRCGVNRMAGEAGYCRLGAKAEFFREMMGFNDVEALMPVHQVYVAGCNMACGYCSVGEWNAAPRDAGSLSTADLTSAIARRQAAGARTLSFIGGEPSVSVSGILELLAQVDPDVRVAWNSNMYVEPIVGELLAGLIDIYVADVKCGNDACARALLDADDYVAVSRARIEACATQNKLFITHLVLPGHGTCCTRPILEWIRDHLPDTPVVLRGDYIPPARAGAAPPHFLSTAEFREAQDYAHLLGLKVTN